jgi:hypothetical protein
MAARRATHGAGSPGRVWLHYDQAIPAEPRGVLSRYPVRQHLVPTPFSCHASISWRGERRKRADGHGTRAVVVRPPGACRQTG